MKKIVCAPGTLLQIVSDYFPELKCLPDALSDTCPLCCLIRKEKKERGVGSRVGVDLGLFTPAECIFPEDGVET